MAIARPGVQRVILATKNTMHTTPTRLVSLGYRNPTALMITPHANATDHRSRALRNKMNFRLEGESYQLKLRDLDNLIEFAKSGFDAQVAAEKQTSTTGSGGIFNFTQNNSNANIGIDFEWRFGHDSRTTKVILEGAKEYDVAKALIAGADDATTLAPSITSLFDDQSGHKGAWQNYPYYGFIKICDPGGSLTEVFSASEILEREMIIKTKSVKNAMNESVHQYLNITVRIKAFDATITKINAILGATLSQELSWKEMNPDGQKFELITIPGHILTLATPEIEIGDENRTQTITLSGDVPINNFAFTYGTAGGGSGTESTVDGIGTTEAQARDGGTLTLS